MSERAIAEIADPMTRAVITGDFALYRQLMTLPMRFTPRGEPPYVLETEAALEADFRLYADIMHLHGVTDIYRKLLSITPTPGGAEARWLTHILVRANLLAEPFETLMRLTEGPDGWRLTEIESSEGHIHWTMGQGSIKDGRFAGKDKDAQA